MVLLQVLTLRFVAGARAASSVAAKPFPVLKPAVRQAELAAAATDTARRFEEAHAQRVALCAAGGGDKAVKRHTQLNKKLLVRDRLRNLLDDDKDFLEIGATAGLDLDYGDVTCGGSIAGIGRISGVSVMITANDATVKGGTMYPITISKMIRTQEIARLCGLPILYIVDSGGAFLPLQSEIFPDEKHGGRVFANQAQMSSEGLEQLSLVSGLCTAGGAYTPTMSNELVMVDQIANIYLGGPPLVKAATGEVITGEELGGARLHCSVSGIADHFAKDEEESFRMIRDICSSLNIHEEAPPATLDEPGQNGLLETVSGLERIERADCYDILSAITDGSRFLEFKSTFGDGLITGYGFVRGTLTGFLINCGALLFRDCQKGAHFVQNCDSRGIPIVFLQNGSNSYSTDCADDVDPRIVLRERAKFIQCQSTVSVPKVVVNVGGASSDEVFTMCGPSFGSAFYFAWPRAMLFKSPLSGEPKSTLDTDAGEITMNSAQYWVSRSTVDGVILPRETRDTIAKCIYFTSLKAKRQHSPRKQAVVRM